MFAEIPEGGLYFLDKNSRGTLLSVLFIFNEKFFKKFASGGGIP
jgi:hypothetical protein